MKLSHLTSATIRRLTVTNGIQQDVVETSFPVGSFGVRVYKSGKKSYFVRYCSPEGNARRITLGSTATIPLKEARKQALALLGQVQQGIDPADKKRCKGATMTVKDLAVLYLDDYAPTTLRPITLTNYRDVIHSYLIPAFGSYRINTLTAGTINSYESQCSAPSQWKAVHTVLLSMYRYALQKGLVDFSPCHGGQIKGYKRLARSRVLTDEELITFWNACDVVSNPAFAVFFRVLLLTSLRAAELFNTLRENVSYGVIRIDSSLAKTGKEFILPVPSQVNTLLNSLPPRADGRLFPPLSTIARKRSHYFQRIREAMGKESADILMHDLRRTCATNLERLGFDNNAIAAVLGHNKAFRHGGVSYAYTYYTFRTEKQEALTAWAHRVFSLIEGTATPRPLYASLKDVAYRVKED